MRSLRLSPYLRLCARRQFRVTRSRPGGPGPGHYCDWTYTSAELLASAHAARAAAAGDWLDVSAAEAYGRDLALAYARRHDGSRR